MSLRAFPRILKTVNEAADEPRTVSRITIADILTNVRSAKQRKEKAKRELIRALTGYHEAREQLAAFLHEMNLDISVSVDKDTDEPAYIHIIEALKTEIGDDP